MRKRTINILSITIIVILAIITVMPAVGFAIGLAVGWNQAETAETTMSYPAAVSFVPDISTYGTPTDTVTASDGTQYPVVLQDTLMMFRADRDGLSTIWISACLSMLEFIFFILFAVAFIKFIININRNIIFVERNVRLLRRISIFLFCIAAMQTGAGLVREFSGLLNDIDIPGYSLTATWTLPWGVLLFGCLALLMSSVWERGLRLKEDQDLTI